MKTQDEINEIRHEDERKLKTIKDTADSIVAKKADEINKKAQKVKDKIQELIDRKHEIFDLPFSKDYTLALMKRGLREKRKQWFFDDVLVRHAKDCQIHATDPLGEPAMRLQIGNESKVWKMMYAVITEGDLEAAVATLPDIGMSLAEKEAGIRKIDEEIKALQEQIKKEFESL